MNQMFGDVVLGIPHASFERHLAELKAQRGTKFDIDLTSDDLQALVKRFKAVYEEHGQSLPQDPWRQLEDGVAAVFRSWNTPRAVKYRQITRLTGLRGTAVNVQAMVFGNVGPTSGTGVCFTRNPAQGTKEVR